MSLPDPNVLEQELDTAVKALVADYRWAFNLAHESPNTSEAKVSGGGTPDPTAGAYSSQAPVRKKLRSVVKVVDRAKKLLGQAHDELDAAFDRADRRCEPLNLITDLHVTQKEVKEARVAQGRRQARGEGFGTA